MRNHIILEMSTLPKKINESTFVYRASAESTYRIEECKGQLEPIPRLMLKKYSDDEEFYIYILCSQKTIIDKQIIDDKEYTAVSFFVCLQSRMLCAIMTKNRHVSVPDRRTIYEQSNL